MLLDECGYCYLQRDNSTLHSLYSGPIPDAFPALEKMITLPQVKDQKKSRKSINHLVKVYLTDFIYKYITFNSDLSTEEKKNSIKMLFNAPKVRKILRFYCGEGKLLFVFTFCYKINAPGLFYFLLKGIWTDV